MKNVVIFGAASDEIPDKYKELAEKTGRIIAESGANLIYGGGATGVMGACVDGYLNSPHNSTPIGTTTTYIKSIEIPHSKVDMLVRGSMAERKQDYLAADIVIFIYGGLGTWDELFEFLTLKRLNIWSGEIIILRGTWQAQYLKATLQQMYSDKAINSGKLDELVKFLDTHELKNALHQAKR